MSSKQQYETLGPANGLYQHKSVPAEDKDVPAFLQDEFLSVGGIVNGILEGGAFPPTAVMPARWREGMMIYFSQAVLPEGNGTQHITSAGIWLYRDSRWWKIIDDPSVLEFSTFAYALGDDQAPATPTTGTSFPPLPQPLWQVTPPAKNTKADYIWASAQVSIDPDGIRVWENPVIWSAGVVDGGDGVDGTSSEFRYIASSSLIVPDFDNDGARNPTTTSLDPYLLNLPATDPGNGLDAIYQTSARINSLDGIEGVWSTPARYSTPDTTEISRAWATSAAWGDPFPTFDPNAPGLPGAGWSYTQPAHTKDFPIWLSERLEWPDSSPQTIWSTPFTYNSEDGEDGLNGDRFETWYKEEAGQPTAPTTYPPTGEGWTIDPPATPVFPIWAVTTQVTDLDVQVGGWSSVVQWSGQDGQDGPEGIRGTIAVTVVDDTIDSTPTPAEVAQKAWDAIVAETVGLNPNQPIPWDAVTFNHSSPATGNYKTYSVRFDTGTVAPGTWADVALVVDGDAIVTGTLHGDKIIADTISGNRINAATEITIGAAGDIVKMSAVDANYRIWVGNTISSSAAFRVTKAGLLTCNNIVANSGTFTGNITSSATITGGSVNSAQMNSANGNFTVNSTGDMTCTNATFNGNTVTTGTIKGDASLHIPSNASTTVGFYVDSSGNLYANNGSFRGTVISDNLQGDVTTVRAYSSSNSHSAANANVVVLEFTVTSTSTKERYLSLSEMTISVETDQVASGETWIEATNTWDANTYSSAHLFGNTSDFPISRQATVFIGMKIPAGDSGTITLRHRNGSSNQAECTYKGALATVLFEGTSLSAPAISLGGQGNISTNS